MQNFMTKEEEKRDVVSLTGSCKYDLSGCLIGSQAHDKRMLIVLSDWR